MAKDAETLSLEEKLRMYEAREAILSRIGSTTFSVIDLDRFLQGTVNEIGKMMGVDRCDIMMLTPEVELRVTHEYRASGPDGEPPTSLGLRIPVDRQHLQQNVDLY